MTPDALPRLILCLRCGFRTSLLTATLCCATLGVAEEKEPKVDSATITQKVAAYFGNQPLNGVPLLDRRINWNYLTNWPDEFSFDGHTYNLRIIRLNGEIISRAEAALGIKFTACYRNKDSGDHGPLCIYSTWTNDGSVSSKEVRIWKEDSYPYRRYAEWRKSTGQPEWLCNYRTVFRCTYYPTGQNIQPGRTSAQNRRGKCGHPVMRD